MERQLDFKRLAIRTNVSVLLGGAVGIPLALAGAGVWALVGQQLTMERRDSCMLIWAMTTWQPRFRFSPTPRARPARLLGQRLRRQPRRLPEQAWRRAPDRHLLRPCGGRGLPDRRPRRRRRPRRDDAPDRRSSRCPCSRGSRPTPTELRATIVQAAADDDARHRSRAGGDLRVQRRGARRARRVLGAGSERAQAALPRRDREGDQLLHRPRALRGLAAALSRGDALDRRDRQHGDRRRRSAPPSPAPPSTTQVVGMAGSRARSCSCRSSCR